MDLAALAERLERISVGYAAREGIDRDDDWFLLKPAVGPQARRGPAAARSDVVGRAWGELGELTQMQLARTGRSKDRGFTLEQLDERLAVGPRARGGPAAARSDVVGRARGECADVLGHVLLFARRNGVDLDRALERKWFRWEQMT